MLDVIQVSYSRNSLKHGVFTKHSVAHAIPRVMVWRKEL